MSLTLKTVLQIVPHLPGTFDGVGDYALNIAKALSADHGITTTFLVAGKTTVTSKEGYTVISGLSREAPGELAEKYEHVILHYVNYGYQARGIPFALRALAKQLRSQLRGRWITMFHELYASGPPWKSAFWLRPVQVRIARDVIDVSTACIVSNAPIREAILAYDPGKKIYLGPVMSNFGEPELTSFDTSPRRWAICGGSALIERSVTLFEQLHQLIPAAFAPERLDVIGGHEENSIRATLDRLASSRPGMSSHYHPGVSADRASEILRQSSFGWLDYFGAGKMWPGMVLKSGAFAAFCAHGIVPVLSHREGPIAVNRDALPGPYYISAGATHFPPPESLREIQQAIYGWYHVHADSQQLARVYAEALS
jgi:hypothetical protein